MSDQLNGVALIKIATGVANVDEFYGVFVAGDLVTDHTGNARRFGSFDDATRAFTRYAGAYGGDQPLRALS